MMRWLRQVGALVVKDLRAEFRELHHILSVALFGVLLLILFSVALSVEPSVMRTMAPGLFWLVLLFASTMSLQHAFRRDTEEGQGQGLLLLGAEPRALLVGKLCANLVFLAIVQVLLLPLMAALFDLPLSGMLIAVMFLGGVGVVTVGTFYAGITATFREGHVLLPLLFFPLMVPVLLGAVQAMTHIMSGDVFGQRFAWFKLLVAFDITSLLVSMLCADTVFEGR